ncbi:MAG: sulfur carrier protein ThiS [Lacipirellulaceae bacterium]
MQIQLNGEPRDIVEGSTVADLLKELELDARSLAVERNLELAPRTEHATTELSEGDRIEIVTLVGGG